jgi:hypothetical protein
MTRTAWIVSASLAALLAIVAILLAVLLTTVNQQAADAEYRQCMDTMGINDHPAGETVEEYAERGVEAAEFCSR